jgi:hypothetical protein
MNIRNPKTGRYTTADIFGDYKITLLERVEDFLITIGETIRSPFRNLYSFVQRGRRGYADVDLIDFDFYLSNMLEKAIGSFRESTIGFPQTKSVKTYQDWLNVLAHIRRGFKASRELQERNFMLYGNEKKNARLKREWERGSMLFIKYFWYLWL